MGQFKKISSLPCCIDDFYSGPTHRTEESKFLLIISDVAVAPNCWCEMMYKDYPQSQLLTGELMLK